MLDSDRRLGDGFLPLSEPLTTLGFSSLREIANIWIFDSEDMYLFSVLCRKDPKGGDHPVFFLPVSRILLPKKNPPSNPCAGRWRIRE